MAKSKKVVASAVDNAVAVVMAEMKKLAVVKKSLDGEVVRTNQRLYKILASIYQQYLDASIDQDVFDAATNQIKFELTVAGGKVQKNSPKLSLFVRYVMGADRQQVHGYTRAIQAGINAGKTPSQLAEYIETQGGVDKCRIAVVVSDEVREKKERLVLAVPKVDEFLDSESKGIGTIKSKPKLVSETVGKGFTFLIGKASADGTIKVLSVVPAYSKSMETWAKKAIAEQLIVEEQEAEKAAKAKAVDDSIDQAVSTVGIAVTSETAKLMGAEPVELAAELVG